MRFNAAMKVKSCRVEQHSPIESAKAMRDEMKTGVVDTDSGREKIELVSL